MSRPYINEELRRLISERADHLCEYCLIHEEDTFLGCQVDHIVSVKHGGSTESDNLAYACAFCNRYKGSDLGSVLLPNRELIRFFDPRHNRWSHHFQLSELMILPLTLVGEVTAKILEFNNDDRCLERQFLITINRYPTAAALRQMER
ncbi:HNH endonuclease [Leptolyngbyaceae cyanobacterium UHCC 1019]